MVSNQVLGARSAGLLTLSLMLAGCGHLPFFRHSQSAAPPAAVAATGAGTSAEAAASAAPAPDMTATEAAIAAAGNEPAPAPAAAPARPVPPNMVNASAPKSYVVKKGDTLWGIASMFLKDPWVWPEVWIINPGIPNPHLIYPGDTLQLAYGANGSPQITVAEAGAARLEATKLD